MLQMNPSSLIFPEIQPLPQVLGDPRLRSDVLLQIQSNPGTYAIFQSFTMQEQEAFLGFCMGAHSSLWTFWYSLQTDVFQPKELISMYSDALRIMDQNMVKYMIDELKVALSQKDSELSAQKTELSQKDSELSQKNSEIERLRTQLAKYEAQQRI